MNTEHMTIEEILNSTELTSTQKLDTLKAKSVLVPQWSGAKGLQGEYEPSMHPVMNRRLYQDIINDGVVTPVTRITLNFQKLAVKRMTELVCGIPVKRVYSPENDKQKEVAGYLEKIFTRTRIDSVNNERLTMLYAGCEVVTLWYATKQENDAYGFHSQVKLRCCNYSPMQGDELYPLFDEYGDMVAMSVAYKRKVGRKTVNYFDAYTSTKHYKFSNEGGVMELVTDEAITLMKIPAVYAYRPTPVWENQSYKVFEMEWALSRNGNYLRENSRPIFAVFANEEVSYGDAPTAAEETEGGDGRAGGFKDVAQFPAGSSAQYITWQQAVDNLKFYIEQLRSLFFTELQLPDWSYEKMSQQALSGESRKQMFIDAQLKVKDESGRLLEFFDREVNVVKAFLKVMLGADYARDIDALQVETQITPFAINDEKDIIANLTAANGGMPIISQRESIEQLGWSDDVDQTLKEIAEQSSGDVFEPFG